MQILKTLSDIKTNHLWPSQPPVCLCAQTINLDTFHCHACCPLWIPIICDQSNHPTCAQFALNVTSFQAWRWDWKHVLLQSFKLDYNFKGIIQKQIYSMDIWYYWISFGANIWGIYGSGYNLEGFKVSKWHLVQTGHKWGDWLGHSWLVFSRVGLSTFYKLPQFN